MLCVAAGVAMSLLVYNPVTGEVHNMLLFRLTLTGFSFLGTGLLYLVLSYIPPVRKYLLRDRGEITVQNQLQASDFITAKLQSDFSLCNPVDFGKIFLYN